MKRFVPRSSLLLLLCAVLSAPAWGQDATGSDPDSEWFSNWKFSVAPYVWLFFVNGDIGAGGKQTSIDANFADLFKNSDTVVALELNLQAQNGPWTVIVDPTWLRATSSFGFDQGLARVSGDVTSDVVLIDAMVLREVTRWDLRDLGTSSTAASEDRFAALDLLGGMRATIIAGDLDLKLQPPGDLLDDVKRNFGSTQSWVDPVVGARATVDCGRFLFVARGDVGGFTLASDITSEMWASALYKLELLGLDAMAGVAFRALYDDYDSDHGFLYKTWTYGPVIGFGVQF